MSGADYGDTLPDRKALVFRGISGIECEHFVRSVRLIALAEGKEDDDRWMLHFATARLSGKAMRWHASLDRDIQKDWYRLVQALLDQYPSYSDEEASTGIVTSAPITILSEAFPEVHAPSSAIVLPARSILGAGLNVGRIRIIPVLGHSNEMYLSRALKLTTVQADAVQVHFTLSDGVLKIGMIEWDDTTDRTGHMLGYNLAVQLNSPRVEICAAYWSQNHVQECWRVGIDGSVRMDPYLFGEVECNKLVVGMYDQSLFFLKDFDVWNQEPGWKFKDHYCEAWLMFEPLFGQPN